MTNVLVVTGQSGAGKSEAVKALEDIGWFVVDNLPPSLMGKVIDLAAVRDTAVRVAIVADIRAGERFVAELETSIGELEGRGIDVRVLYLEADDATLIRRFEGVRRPHPLGDALPDAIAREHELLAGLRARADVVVNTSDVNVHQLRTKLNDLFDLRAGAGTLQVSLVSFGFKYGLPLDADMVFDVRFLPNPHWVDDLRPLPGTDRRVRDYVLGQPGTRDFLDRTGALVSWLLPRYSDEGKAYLTLAIGCTGGRHRAVVISESLAELVVADGFPVVVRHRDVEK